VENRPGGGTNIDAPAGGYTLLLAGAVNAVNATLYEKLNFDFIRDIAPGATGSSPGATRIHHASRWCRSMAARAAEDGDEIASSHSLRPSPGSRQLDLELERLQQGNASNGMEAQGPVSAAQYVGLGVTSEVTALQQQ
jgi:hypothetical protein